jgi:uncharacterized phage protein (TIGR01671 family)
MIPNEFRVYHKIDGMKYFGDITMHMLLNGDLFYDDITTSEPAYKPAYKVDGYIAMQYTGIGDKTGKKIFESDILHNEKSNQWYKVFKVPGGFGINTHQEDLNKPNVFFYMALSDRQNAGWLNALEIKGNIYENPELLQKK